MAAKEKKESKGALSIDGAKGKKKGAMPSKTTMNLAFHESNFKLSRVLPIVLIIIVAAGLFTKFGILDQLDKKTAAYAALTDKQVQLAAVEAQLAGYDELADEYGRYSSGWMDDAEAGLVDRNEVFSLIESKLGKSCIIEDFSLNSNVLTITIYNVTLDEARIITQELEEEPLVESATVYSAVADDETLEAEVFMSIILTKEVDGE